ncbi:hypothetical protein DPMN_163640 [Dreissena polymorpha]|uniref:Uncharacterized protein n=1 Tax=Dreissena polymorpha TaxID=45954 RepID=A0A9D4ETM2_DREPO|nr:hypothetical protein DPMN_163640 [Dreissena polymorpha]
MINLRTGTLFQLESVPLATPVLQGVFSLTRSKGSAGPRTDRAGPRKGRALEGQGTEPFHLGLAGALTFFTLRKSGNNYFWASETPGSWFTMIHFSLKLPHFSLSRAEGEVTSPKNWMQLLKSPARKVMLSWHNVMILTFN